MSIVIAFIGGPVDGQLSAIPNDGPPPLYLIPTFPAVATLLDDPLTPTPMRAAEYEPVLAAGWPSRNDSGHYLYRYRGTPEPPHPQQARPTPGLEELAVMRRDPPASAYPDSRSHLLACRTRYSLYRDTVLTPEERAAIDGVTVAHMRAALRERHRPA